MERQDGIFDRVLIEAVIRTAAIELGTVIVIPECVTDIVARFYPIVTSNMERNVYDLGDMLFGKVNEIKKNECLNLWKARLKGYPSSL